MTHPQLRMRLGKGPCRGQEQRKVESSTLSEGIRFALTFAVFPNAPTLLRMPRLFASLKNEVSGVLRASSHFFLQLQRPKELL